MGNCVSASGIILPKIRVVQASEGRVVDVELPPLQSSMKVGELMLEFPPAHFVTQLNVKPEFSASTGMRATPLGADADAKPGIAYVLFPMSRLHTRITPQEVLSFSKLIQLQDQQLMTKPAHNPASVHVHGLFTAGARVAPLVEEECKDVNLCRGAYTTEQAYPLPSTPQMSYEESSSYCMLSSCRQGHMGVIKAKPWAPALQTIMESS